MTLSRVAPLLALLAGCVPMQRYYDSSWIRQQTTELSPGMTSGDVAKMFPIPPQNTEAEVCDAKADAPQKCVIWNYAVRFGQDLHVRFVQGEDKSLTVRDWDWR